MFHIDNILSIIRLKKLYIETEDIWNYRTMLTNEQKKKYTRDGKAFITPIYKIFLICIIYFKLIHLWQLYY